MKVPGFREKTADTKSSSVGGNFIFFSSISGSLLSFPFPKHAPGRGRRACIRLKENVSVHCALREIESTYSRTRLIWFEGGGAFLLSVAGT